MSKEIAFDNICLKDTSHWAHTEYSLRYHIEYFAVKTGLSIDDEKLEAEIYNTAGLDFIFITNDGLIDWDEAGRTTNMGHAVYASDGSDKKAIEECPFKSVEEVWEFDAVKEYGLPDFAEQVKVFEEWGKELNRLYPNQLTTGGNYKTLISGALATFGWDMLLMGCSDMGKMAPVL
ncbi:MAG: hypothetical protein ACYTFY_10380, partial [Planctomycetota bacterium]